MWNIRFGRIFIKMSITDLIASLALATSIISLGYQIYSNRSMLERDLYADVFRDYLMKSIPYSRNVLRIHDGRLHSYELQKCLSDLRRDILYFKFTNSVFYDTMNGIIIDIDELLVELANEDNENQVRMRMSEIDYKINQIYDEVSNIYIHGN